ncbi:MAG: MobA/MobL family protein, partial [Nanopusillaceae archaeon]
AHILLTTRRIDKKTGKRLGDKIDELRNPAKSGKELKALRQIFQDIVNEYLPPDKQIDMRSYVAQGSERPGQVHLGRYRIGKERRTGQKDELRQEYEQELENWKEREAMDKLLKLLPLAWKMKIEGIRRDPRSGEYQWNTNIFPVDNCRELIPLLEQAIREHSHTRQRRRSARWPPTGHTRPKQKYSDWELE